MSEDPNKGVIRLQIEDFGGFDEEEYEEEDIGNNDWTLGVYPHTDKTKNEKYLGVYLKCNENLNSNLWSCNASVRFSLIKFSSDDKDTAFSIDYVKKFTRNDNKLDIPTFKKFEDVENPSNLFVVGNNVVIEVSVSVNSSHGWNKLVHETFHEPKENMTDVVLLVEGKKVHVGKQVLAMHSRYFHTLFFSNFKESTEKEIPIEDVVHSEFIELLNLIYPSHKQIDDDNFNYILKLADRFEFWVIVERSEKFLIKSDEIHMVEKLKLAETYKLALLQDRCFDLLETNQEVFDLMKHERYHELGDVTLSLLFQKLAKINQIATDTQH